MDKIVANDDHLFRKEQLSEYETQTPEDVATFLNQQIDFLSQHLSDDMFFNLLKIWLLQLQNYVSDYNDRFK